MLPKSSELPATRTATLGERHNQKDLSEADHLYLSLAGGNTSHGRLVAPRANCSAMPVSSNCICRTITSTVSE